MHTFVFIRMPVYFCPFWWISAFWPLHTHDTAQQQHSNCSKGTNMYIKHTYVQIWYTVYIYTLHIRTHTYYIRGSKVCHSFFPTNLADFNPTLKKIGMILSGKLQPNCRYVRVAFWAQQWEALAGGKNVWSGWLKKPCYLDVPGR